ncbi:MAG: histone deacetylase [Spirochaetaceae bacterium]|nr:MAG: histone deacetylase [Spirochaetaceae bacterium]
MNKVLKTGLFMSVIILFLFNCTDRTAHGNNAGGMRGTDSEKLPIIYSPGYSISLLGLEQLHAFDTAKYRTVYDFLRQNTGIAENRFHTPSEVTDRELLLVHTPGYLESLRDPRTASIIAGLTEVSLVPAQLIEKGVYTPMRLATGGTVMGVSLALAHGWAINLSGGYHHAKADSGDGFCYFADIPIAVRVQWEKTPEMKVLIVDLDAHQGNGYEIIFGDDKRIAILDIFNADIYPHDEAAKKYIDFPHPIASGTGDRGYLALLEKVLPEALDTFSPGLVIYNAGTDIFEEDPLGKLEVTARGIVKRDEIVFQESMKRKIPVLMLLSGGYTKKSGRIIAESCDNLVSSIIGKGGQP